MNVILAAGGGSIPEPRGDRLDRIHDIVLTFCFGLGRSAGAQVDGGMDSTVPSAEIFGGNIFARDFAQIVVDHGGIHGHDIARLVDVFEQLVTRQIAAAGDDSGQAAVGHLKLVDLSALAAKAEANLATVHLDVLAAHGGHAVGIVLAGVLFVAHADVSQIHEPDNRGEHSLFGYASFGYTSRGEILFHRR